MELRQINAGQVLDFGKALQDVPTNGLDCTIKLFRLFIMGNPEGDEYTVVDGLYSRWLEFGSPVVNHDNWQSFVSYVNEHGGLLEIASTEGVEVADTETLASGSDIPAAV